MPEWPEYRKDTHEKAEYEHPAKGKNHCGICEYFIDAKPARCQHVKSPIRAEDWCHRFQRKTED
jgi:hypothetical protein